MTFMPKTNNLQTVAFDGPIKMLCYDTGKLFNPNPRVSFGILLSFLLLSSTIRLLKKFERMKGCVLLYNKSNFQHCRLH